jgi:hypothetical protein
VLVTLGGENGAATVVEESLGVFDAIHPWDLRERVVESTIPEQARHIWLPQDGNAELRPDDPVVFGQSLSDLKRFEAVEILGVKERQLEIPH